MDARISSLVTLPKASDFFGNDEIRECIRNMIDASNTNKNALLVIGPSGSGKTTLCKLILKDHTRDTCFFRPNYDDYGSHKELVEALDQFISAVNLQSFKKKRPMKKVLFLDDVDVFLTIDRYANTYIQGLVKLCKSNHAFKLLMTCAQGNEKKVTDIKKKVPFKFIVNPPNENVVAMMRMVATHISETRTTPSIERSVWSSYCNAYANNVRMCCMNLQKFLDNTSGAQDDFHIVFDKNITDTAKSIMCETKWTMKGLGFWLSNDASLISYIIYDNVFGILDRDAELVKVVNAFAISSVFEDWVYAKSDAFLNDILNVCRCGQAKLSMAGSENKLLGKSIKYTTIPTRCSNYYSALKKNSVGSSQNWMSRTEMIWGQSLGYVADDSMKTLLRRLS